MFVGIDFGGTKTLVASADENGNIIKRVRKETPQGVSDGIEMFKEMVRDVSNGEKIDSIGCSSGGPLDWKNGIVSPLHMPQWSNVPLKEIMEKEFGCSFYVDNDCNVAALGELTFGKGMHYNHFVYITISTGLGGGIVKDKAIFRGRDGEHPEIGHQCIHTTRHDVVCRCGGKNCLESLISGYAIERHYGKKAENLTTGEWIEIGTMLGDGLRNIIANHAPEAIFLGGGVSVGAGEKLLAPAMKVVEENVKIIKLPVIDIASLGYDAPLKGAIALAIKGHE